MGKDSITKKCMEYQPDRKETMITLLCTGIIFGSMSYYSSKTYLISGTVSFITYQGLAYEKENGPSKALEEGAKKQGNSNPLPLRVLSFMVLSSFIGKSIRESWVKPTHLQPASWPSHLLKPPFHVASFFMVARSAWSESAEIGYHIPRISEKHVTIAFVASTVLSAAMTYSVPEVHLPSGVVSLGTIPGILTHILSEDSKAEMISSITAIKVALCWSIGSYVGRIARAFIGPTNYTPTRSWLAFFSLLPIGVVNVVTVLLLQSLLSAQANLKETIDNEDENASPEESVSNVLKLFLQMFRSATDELQYLPKGMTVEDLRQKLDNDFDRLPHPESGILQPYAQYFFEWLVLQVAERNNQEVDEAIQSFTRAFNREFERAQAFLDKEFEKETQAEYEPEELTKAICQQDPKKHIDALRERIAKFNEKRDEIDKKALEKGLRAPSRSELTQSEAAHILLIDMGWDEAQKKGNYKALSIIAHPDKCQEKDKELFKDLGAAAEALKLK